jgi:SAM-dependent methyltransferase
MAWFGKPTVPVLPHRLRKDLPKHRAYSEDYKLNSDRVDFWDKFYAGARSTTLLNPSQFAAFALGEASDATEVIEFGCGNGRGSEFFASHGLSVTALDASEQAIALCEMRRRHRNVRYEKYALGDQTGGVFPYGPQNGGNTLIYARFFLHAIDEREEDLFLKLTSRLATKNSIVALEYRCLDDVNIKKEFGDHFRRYIQHDLLCKKMESLGFEIAYQIKGRGMAKYKSEDAVVGRCIAMKSF